MSESLTELIADKLELKPEEAELALSNYVGELEKSIRAGNVKRIAGFGVFECSDARIQFTPDEALRQLVNFRYQSLPDLCTTPWVEELTEEAGDALVDDPVAPPADDTTETKRHQGDPAGVSKEVWDAAIFDDDKPMETASDHPPVTGSSDTSESLRPAPHRSSRVPYIVLPILAIVVAAISYLILDGSLLLCPPGALCVAIAFQVPGFLASQTAFLEYADQPGQGGTGVCQDAERDGSGDTEVARVDIDLDDPVPGASPAASSTLSRATRPSATTPVTRLRWARSRANRGCSCGSIRVASARWRSTGSTDRTR